MFISVSGLSKSYGVGASYVKVLDGIELEIERGAIAVILGANGSGLIASHLYKKAQIV